MESTLNPNQTDPRDVLFARADEELAHAYEQIKRANEELARADEQFSKLERDAARQTSAKRGNRPSLVRGFTGLLMAACIGVAAIVWQSSYGDAAKQIIARWAPQSTMTSSLPLEKTGLPALPVPITVQAAAGLPSWRSCSRRWRAISQPWSKRSCSSRSARNNSRPARNNWPATTQRPLTSSRRTRNK